MRVLVFGSLNIDRVYTVPHMVRPGETLSSTQLQYHCGGKGLNQSIALARAGLPVCHAGKIGTDGAMLTAHLRRAGVDTAYVLTDPDVPSGHAVIQVDPSGENSILVYPGANAAISSEMVQNTLSHFTAGDFLLLQNEISCLGELIRQAKERGMTVALNPSPISDGLLQCESLPQVDWFIINELEGAQFAGSSVPDEICDRMLSPLSPKQNRTDAGRRRRRLRGRKGAAPPTGVSGPCGGHHRRPAIRLRDTFSPGFCADRRRRNACGRQT